MNLEGRNQRSIRLENLIQALRIIMFKGPCTRRDLAKQMSLTKMSISNMVNTFISHGLVEEVELSGDKPVTVGPKPVLLKIAAGKMVAIGIHITEYSITGQLYDLVEGVLAESKMLVDTIGSKTHFASTMKRLVDQLMEHKKSEEINIVAIGITDDHFINRTEGTVLFKGNTLGIDRSSIKEYLEQSYKIPVYIENEQLGVLLTEMAYGLYDMQKIYYMSISDEIRGAYTSEYYVQKGCVGLAGMVGHMSIKCDGPRCSCGNRGCYEKYGSISALLKDSNCSSIEELNSNLKNRDPLALRALENFIQATTVALTNIVNLYDPEAIVIAGKLLKLDSSVLKKIEYLVNNSFVFRKHRSIGLIPSVLREEDYRKGAPVLALYQVLSDENYIFSVYDTRNSVV